MKKKILYLIGLIIILSVVNGASAFASVSSFDQIWMVKGDKETTAYTEFAWGETPWLYLRLPAAPGSFGWKSSVTSDWLFDDTWQGLSDSNVNVKSYWLRLSDWDTLKQVGTWTVDASYEYAKTGQPSVFGYGSTAFTVTAVPEPISSALFLLGGTLLAARQYRKKRKNNMTKNLMVFLLGIAVLAFAGNAFAATTTNFGATNDAYVYEGSSGNDNFGSATTLLVASPSGSNNDYWSYLQFDIASALTNQTVTAADLYLYCTSTSSYGSRTVNVFDTANNWTEGNIIWTNKPSTGTADGTVTIPKSGFGAWYSWNVLSLINTSEAPQSFLVKTSSTGNTIINFASSEFSTASLRPYLKVTAVPEPISSALFLIGGTMLAVRQYRKKRKV